MSFGRCSIAISCSHCVQYLHVHWRCGGYSLWTFCCDQFPDKTANSIKSFHQMGSYELFFRVWLRKKTGTERCLKIIKLSATNRADLICCCVLTFFLSQGQKGEPGDITDVSWCHTHNMQQICVVIWKSLFVNYVRTVNPEVTEISFKLTRHTQNSPPACSGEVFRYFTGNWTTSKTSSKDNTSHTQAEGQKSPLFYPLLV